MKKYFTIFAMSAGILFASQMPTRAAGWIICNHSSKDVFAAISWVDPGSGVFRSKGWFRLGACTGCQKVWNGLLPQDGDNPSQSAIFMHAENADKNLVWGTQSRRCVQDPGPFDRIQANIDANCQGPGARMVGFDFMSFPRDADHTTNLTVNPPQCHIID